MTPDEFEALIREQLAERDRRRRARLLDPVIYAEADQLCVDAIMLAAGFGPAADTEPVVAKATRSRRLNAEAALGAA